MSENCPFWVANDTEYILNNHLTIFAQYNMLIIQKKKVELAEILAFEVLVIKNTCLIFVSRVHGTVAETIVYLACGNLFLYDISHVLTFKFTIAFDGQYSEACLSSISKGSEYFLCFGDGFQQAYPSCSFVNIDEISTFVPALLQGHELIVTVRVVPFVVVEK